MLLRGDRVVHKEDLDLVGTVEHVYYSTSLQIWLAEIIWEGYDRTSPHTADSLITVKELTIEVKGREYCAILSPDQDGYDRVINCCDQVTNLLDS